MSVEVVRARQTNHVLEDSLDGEADVDDEVYAHDCVGFVLGFVLAEEVQQRF